MLLNKIKALEDSLHTVRRHDPMWLDRVLHSNFTEITYSGHLVNRAKVIQSLLAETDAPEIFGFNYSLIEIDSTHVILTYRTQGKAGCRRALRSSLWVYSESYDWQIVFHQGTPDESYD